MVQLHYPLLLKSTLALVSVVLALFNARAEEKNDTIVTGSQGRIDCVKFSPDGRLIAAVVDGTVKVWAYPSKKQLHALVSQEKKYGYNSIVFSTDGARLLASSPKSLVSCDLKTMQCTVLGTLDSKSVLPSYGGLRYGSRFVLITTTDGDVQFFDSDTLKRKMSLKLVGKNSFFTSVQRDDAIFYLDNSGVLVRYTFDGMRKQESVKLPVGGVGLCIDDAGRRIAVNALDEIVECDVVGQGDKTVLKLRPRLVEKLEAVLAMRYQTNRLLVASQLGAISTVGEGKERRLALLKIPEEVGQSSCADFSSDGSLCALGGVNGTLTVVPIPKDSK